MTVTAGTETETETTQVHPAVTVMPPPTPPLILATTVMEDSTGVIYIQGGEGIDTTGEDRRGQDKGQIQEADRGCERGRESGSPCRVTAGGRDKGSGVGCGSVLDRRREEVIVVILAVGEGMVTVDDIINTLLPLTVVVVERGKDHLLRTMGT